MNEKICAWEMRHGSTTGPGTASRPAKVPFVETSTENDRMTV